MLVGRDNDDLVRIFDFPKSVRRRHLTLANERGTTFGGHLQAGTIVFAAEFVIETFEGPDFRRETTKRRGCIFGSGWLKSHEYRVPLLRQHEPGSR